MNFTAGGASLAIFNENENAGNRTARGGKAGLGGVPKRALQDVTNATQQSSGIVGKKQQTTTGRGGVAQQRRTLQPTGSTSTFATAMSEMTLGGAVDDIDALDRHDPQAVVEYLPDIMEHLRAFETKWLPSPDYMHAQTDINEKMRAILIDWLIDVHLKFKLVPETMYLTVNIIDRFLSAKHVARKKLQLVGVTAMLIASKYEEIYAPEVKDFVYISDKAYSRDEILKMESLMLNTLGFNLTVPSALTFVTRFVKASGNGADKEFEMLSTYMVELMLQEYFMIKYLPSMVAASAVYLSFKILGRSGWTSTMHRYTQYSEAALKNCSTDLFGLLKAARTNPQLQAVKKKYSSVKFSEVANIPIEG